jgi:hypothetical protein
LLRPTVLEGTKGGFSRLYNFLSILSTLGID